MNLFKYTLYGVLRNGDAGDGAASGNADTQDQNGTGNNTGQGNAGVVGGPGQDDTNNSSVGPNSAQNSVNESNNSIGAAASVGAADVADDGSIAIAQQVVEALAVQQAIQDQQMMADQGITSPADTPNVVEAAINSIANAVNNPMGVVNNITVPDVMHAVMSNIMGVNTQAISGIAQGIGSGINAVTGATNEGAAQGQAAVGTGGVGGASQPDDIGAIMTQMAGGGQQTGSGPFSGTAPPPPAPTVAPGTWDATKKGYFTPWEGVEGGGIYAPHPGQLGSGGLGGPALPEGFVPIWQQTLNDIIGTLDDPVAARGLPDSYNGIIEDYVRGKAETGITPGTSLDMWDDAFASDSGDTILNNEQTRRRGQYTNSLNSIFGDNYAETALPFTLDDDYIGNYINQAYATTADQLRQRQARGQLSDLGFNVGQNTLNQQREKATSTFQGLGEDVITGYRGDIDKIIDNAYKGASNYTLGQSYDPASYQSQAESRKNDLTTRLQGDLISTIGTTDPFDIGDVISKGAAASGPLNSMPDVVARRSSNRVRNDRGLGSQGVF